MTQNLLNLNNPSKVLGASGVNCAETVEFTHSGEKDLVSELKTEVGLLCKELSEVKLNVKVAGSYFSSGPYTEEFYPEDDYQFLGEAEDSADYDSYYSGRYQYRPFRRPGRGYRGGYRGYRGYRGQRRSNFGSRNRGGFGNVQDSHPGSESFQRYVGPEFSQSSNSRSGSDENKFCKYCKRPGHVWSTCWDLKR